MGQVLDDRYEIVRRLARGGMAAVYLAEDRRLSRTVALKIMHEGLGDDAEFAIRLDAEARAAARLAHPNVVSVFDQGSDLGRPYIVMEYVRGGTLRQLITREAPMDPLRALELIEPVAAALAAAHACGLIHRDVKPENVLISDRGQIKVADFGLARAVTAHSHAASTGLVIGTVSYIAPELVTRGRADARSDVYSTGVVLYEMLTGLKPHTGDNPVAVAYSHVHNQIPPPSHAASAAWQPAPIPDFVDELVVRAAARERSERPANAGVLLEHLRSARTALAGGVTSDKGLVAQMRTTELTESASTTRVSSLVAAGTASGRSLPVARPAESAEELRFTVSTPVSPSFEVFTDGAPYYSSTPVSPVTADVPSIPGEPSATAPPRRRRRTRRWAWLLTSLVLAAVLGVGGWWLLAGRYVPAPQLVGMNQAAAVTEAAAMGLRVDFDHEYSETVPVGQVVRTDPDTGGQVLADGTMKAWLSRGPERFRVPQLVGLTQDAATAQLTESSLQVGAVTLIFDDKIPAGQVTAQDPTPGRQAKRGAEVALTVSQGPAPVDLVDWSGKKWTDARSVLSKAGLKPTASEENSDTVAKGLVISQGTPAGQLHRGDAVTFVVSKGPVLVKVPNVRRLGASAAIARLQAAGFEVQSVRVVNSGLGLALRTNPPAGRLAPKGSAITLYLV